jgi:pimeloyl-ACP methyl ester carboxylesterase
MNKEIKISGRKIFYRVHGKGNPVMLVHGFGEMGNVWDKQVEALENKYMLMVPDLPGSGKSEMIDDMSIEGMAEVLKTIADKEKISLFILIGHSMGGYITLAFAEKYPQYLIKFGLFHSSAYADNEEKKSVRRKGIEFIKEHGAFEFLKNTTPNLFSPDTKFENQQLIDDFINELNDFSPEALVSYYEAMIKRPDRTEILINSKTSVLFVMGKYDVAVPMEDGLKLCHLPGKSYIDILKESGHMGMIEEPAKSNKILEEFLS